MKMIFSIYLNLRINLFGNTCLDWIIVVGNMCISHMEKRKIRDVVLEGIRHVILATPKSTCCGGICYLNVDDMWDLFKSLAWYQWQFE